MAEPLLFHNGQAYRISAETAADLLSRGVIVRDGAEFALSLQHLFEEIEPLVTPLPAPEPVAKDGGSLGHRRLRWFWILNPRGDARQSTLSPFYRDSGKDDPRQR